MIPLAVPVIQGSDVAILNRRLTLRGADGTYIESSRRRRIQNGNCRHQHRVAECARRL